MRGIAKKTMVLLLVVILTEITIVFEIQALPQIDEKSNNIIVINKNEGKYKTIQEAIDEAKEGSTIILKEGIYNETINIKKEIYLIGENKDKTILNCISEKNKYAICLSSSGAIIKNLTITNKASGLYTTAIRISAPKTEVNNCNIYETPVGIAIWTSENKIDSCVFWKCKDEGIALIGSEKTKCNNNTIKNCQFYDNCDGIELQYSSDNNIINCEFINNSHTGIDAIISSNNDNIISNCTITNNTVNGIYLSKSSRNQIIACSIKNNNDGDIVLTENSYDNNIDDKNEIINKITNASLLVKEIRENVQNKFRSNKEIDRNKNIINRVINMINDLIDSINSLPK